MYGIVPRQPLFLQSHQRSATWSETHSELILHHDMNDSMKLQARHANLAIHVKTLREPNSFTLIKR
ncbi:hypothetical protein A4W93_21745 [Piscinibacter gummiphilus]|uniref:Uncharacterized protein n=1 Tax=Piscinibacter gummiphilus TaxID=946333 RepID=A0A1W6LDG3_9BURK|nr:hypothetical protein A4W93_21745 [Piscinibacter gummiphilus]